MPPTLITLLASCLGYLWMSRPAADSDLKKNIYYFFRGEGGFAKKSTVSAISWSWGRRRKVLLALPLPEYAPPPDRIIQEGNLLNRLLICKFNIMVINISTTRLDIENVFNPPPHLYLCSLFIRKRSLFVKLQTAYVRIRYNKFFA